MTDLDVTPTAVEREATDDSDGLVHFSCCRTNDTRTFCGRLIPAGCGELVSDGDYEDQNCVVCLDIGGDGYRCPIFPDDCPREDPP